LNFEAPISKDQIRNFNENKRLESRDLSETFERVEDNIFVSEKNEGFKVFIVLKNG